MTPRLTPPSSGPLWPTGFGALGAILSLSSLTLMLAGALGVVVNIHSDSAPLWLLLLLGHFLTVGWVILSTGLAIWGVARGKALPGALDLALAALAASVAIVASFRLWWA